MVSLVRWRLCPLPGPPLARKDLPGLQADLYDNSQPTARASYCLPPGPSSTLCALAAGSFAASGRLFEPSDVCFRLLQELRSRSGPIGRAIAPASHLGCYTRQHCAYHVLYPLLALCSAFLSEGNADYPGDLTRHPQLQGLGEDGPTHQPIETLSHFRSLPNCLVWRCVAF